MDDEDRRTSFTDVWRRHLFAINPELRRTAVQADRGTISLSLDISNTLRNLSNMINRVQRYKCSEYYQRRKKNQRANDPTTFYRFYFPRELQPSIETSKKRNLAYQMFYTQSNQTMLNYYNLLVLLAQRANIDISLYTDLQAAVEYLGKYYTKAEVALFSFEETLKALIPIVLSTNQPIIQLAAKAINKIVGSRNQGA